MSDTQNGSVIDGVVNAAVNISERTRQMFEIAYMQSQNNVALNPSNGGPATNGNTPKTPGGVSIA